MLFLHRVNTDEDEPDVHAGREVKVVVAKNRFGPTGSVGMRFFPAKQRFVVTPKE